MHVSVVFMWTAGHCQLMPTACRPSSTSFCICCVKKATTLR